MTREQKDVYRRSIVMLIDGFFGIDKVMRELKHTEMKHTMLKLGTALDELIEFDEELKVVTAPLKEVK